MLLLPITEALLPAQALMLPQQVILQHGKLPINRVGNPEIPDMLLQQAPISFPIPKSLQLRVLFPFPVPKMGLYSKKKTVMHSDMHHGFST